MVARRHADLLRLGARPRAVLRTPARHHLRGQCQRRRAGSGGVHRRPDPRPVAQPRRPPTGLHRGAGARSRRGRAVLQPARTVGDRRAARRGAQVSHPGLRLRHRRERRRRPGAAARRRAIQAVLECGLTLSLRRRGRTGAHQPEARLGRARRSRGPGVVADYGRPRHLCLQRHLRRLTRSGSHLDPRQHRRSVPGQRPDRQARTDHRHQWRAVFAAQPD